MKKFTVNSKLLVDKLVYMGGLINTKATLQILECYLFKINRDKLTVIATDLENTMQTSISLDEDSGVHFEVCLESKVLTSILKSIAAQPVVFEQGGKVMVIKTFTGLFEIPFFETEEFPALPEIEPKAQFNILSGSLMNAISKCLITVSTDELRPMLCGVYFELSDGQINFVSTDAHRMVIYAVTNVDVSSSDSFVVPKKPLTVLKSMLESVEGEVLVKYNDINIVFDTEDFILTSRLSEGKFPNYEAVIPKKSEKKLIVQSEMLKSAVKRVSLCSSKETHQVVLNITPEKLCLQAEDVDFLRRSEDNLPCNFNTDNFRIGFNAALLVQLLSVVDSADINIEMSEPIRGAIITPVESITENQSMKMLIMPVMVSGV